MTKHDLLSVRFLKADLNEAIVWLFKVQGRLNDLERKLDSEINPGEQHDDSTSKLHTARYALVDGRSHGPIA
jgi:hypothetical protein